MKKIIPITPTSLNTMMTCPRQFEAKYVTKEVKFQETAATIWGNRLHKAMEDNIKRGTAFSDEAMSLKPWVDAFKAKAQAENAQLLSETKLAIDPEGNPTSWRDRYIGGIADVVILGEKQAFIGDLKTGKKRDDPTQLTILAKCLYATYPKIERINAALFYPHLPDFIRFTTKRTTFDDTTLMAQIKEYIRIQEEYDYKPKPSGLCGKWCDVVSCQFNGRNKGAFYG